MQKAVKGNLGKIISSLGYSAKEIRFYLVCSGEPLKVLISEEEGLVVKFKTHFILHKYRLTYYHFKHLQKTFSGYFCNLIELRNFGQWDMEQGQ